MSPRRRRLGGQPGSDDAVVADLRPGHKSLLQVARAALAAHGWPGKVRELRHGIEAAALLGDGDVIDSM